MCIVDYSYLIHDHIFCTQIEYLQDIRGASERNGLILAGTPQWDTFSIDSDTSNLSADIFKNIQIDLSVK